MMGNWMDVCFPNQKQCIGIAASLRGGVVAIV